jgi:uncharacterized protein (DUF433 family)
MKPQITLDPHILVGKPTLNGTRISVEFILELLAARNTYEDILHHYPHLTVDDITACIEYALDLVRQQRALPAAVVSQ